MKRQTTGARSRGARWEVVVRALTERPNAPTAGPHGARADACASKGEARGKARGWRSPPPLRRAKRDAEAPEEPEVEPTATQEEARGEAEAEVAEEEGGSGPAAMEFGE